MTDAQTISRAFRNGRGEAPAWTDEEYRYIREHSHLSTAQIASALGRTVEAVMARARRIGVHIGRGSRDRTALRTQAMAALPSRILADIEYDLNGGCWLWAGPTYGRYGRISVAGAYALVHRAAWEAFRGPIPDETLVCHRCDVPHCMPIRLTPTDTRCRVLVLGRFAPRKEEIKTMQINGTPQEINTVRAALRAHDDKIIDAMSEARRRKDDEHITFLKVEQHNIRQALKAIGYAYAEGV